MAKLRTLTQVMPRKPIHDSVRDRRMQNPMRKDYDLLRRCEQAWNNLEDVRRVRERVKNYVYGDQWGDVIEYHKGTITERRYIQETGGVPLQNNIMISVLNSIVGLYAKQGTEPNCFAVKHDGQWLSDMMSATVQSSWQKTQMPDVLKNAFGDYASGGVAVARETYEERDGYKDTWTDYVNPNYCFWIAGSDVRMTDLELIGVLHDVAPGKLYRKFCNKEYGLTVAQINEIFDIPDDKGYRSYYRDSGNQQNDNYKLDNVSFSTPANEGKCRLIEVWTKETKTRYQCYDPLGQSTDDMEYRVEVKDIQHIIGENLLRKQQYDEVGVPEEDRAYIEYELIEDEYWYYTYMAPNGTVIAKGETPYDFHSHPFTIHLYPYINGEIHPYMSNIIDQQRYFNRCMILQDLAVRSAAKGVMIFPEENIPEGMTKDDIAEAVTSYDGLIFVKTNNKNPNLRPEIITSNAVQIGTTEIMQMQLNLMREITNVSGALQGKTPSAGTSAARYAQESQNSTTSLFTLLQDFTSFSEAIARKKVMMIKQFYPDKKLITNVDKTGIIEYDRMSARDVDFEINIKEAAATASVQMMVNDTATKLLQMGAINIKQWLASVNIPFKDDLLRQIESDEAAAMAQQQALGADPNTMAAAQNMLRTQGLQAA